MTEAKKAGFWTSILGILTGLAAVITAVAGLVVAISRLGPPSASEVAHFQVPQLNVNALDLVE